MMFNPSISISASHRCTSRGERQAPDYLLYLLIALLTLGNICLNLFCRYISQRPRERPHLSSVGPVREDEDTWVEKKDWGSM